MKKHIKKLNDHLPTTGKIRMITLTEKQYSKIMLFQEVEDKQKSKI